MVVADRAVAGVVVVVVAAGVEVAAAGVGCYTHSE